MPFSRPSLEDLILRTEAEITSRLPTQGKLLPRSVLAAIARATAGLSHELHGFLAHIARQVIPDTAETEALDRWASVFGLQRLAAAFSIGSIDFTGSNGSAIPAGTTLRRADGVEFTTDALGTIAGGTATVAVTAVLAGSEGDTLAGVTLTLVAPVAGIDSEATVAAGGLGGGADRESDDALRVRLRERIQDPPQGGAAADYVLWAKTVPGVSRVWVFPVHFGLGTVGITFARDADLDGPIPDAGEVTAVQTAIDALRPVTADAQVFAPAAVDLDPSVQLEPNTAEVQAQVTAALEDLILREAVPGGTLEISKIQEAISTAPGEVDHVLLVPAANVVYDEAELGTIGTPVYAPIP